MSIIYQAGPVFSEAEQSFHRYLTLLLERADYTVIWPGDLLTTEEITEAGADGSRLIFESCRKALDGSDCVVALLDGPQVDDGTAWEIGYAHAKGLPVYGIRTDFRQAGDTPYNNVNSMIQQCLAGLAHSTEDLMRMLKDWTRNGGTSAADDN